MPAASSRRDTARTLLVVALALTALPVAAVEKPEGKAVQHQGFALTLPTGLRIVAYQLAEAPRASVGVSWLAGSMDDPPGKEGLAHLVEHLAFRRRVTGGTVWQRLQGDGVAFNAFTVHDATVYFEAARPDQLRQLLSVEAERMKDPLFGVTEEDFVTERDVVISELRERSQRFDVMAGFEALQARLFGPQHPYGRSVGGTEESVRRIAWADVRAFVARLYRPERAVLAVVSPRPARDASQLALDQLGTWASGPTDTLVLPTQPATRPAVPDPPDPPADLLQLPGAVTRPVLMISFQVPGDSAEAGPMARAAARALQQAMYRRLLGRGDYDKIASIGVSYDGHDGAGELTAMIELEDGVEPKRVLEAVRDNLLSVEDGNDDARTRAKLTLQSRDAQLMATYMSLERLDAAGLASFTRATGKLDAIRGRQLQIPSLNQTIESFWHTYLRRERSAAVVVLPDPSSGAAPPAGGDLTSRMPESQSDRDLDFTPRRPVAEVARPPGLDKARRFRLQNGLSVTLVNRPLLPLAEVTLVVPTDLAGLRGGSTSLPEFAMDFAGTAADARWSHAARLGMQGFTRPELEGVTFQRRGTSATLRQILEDVERLTHNFEFSRTRATLIRDGLVKNRVATLRKPEARAAMAFRGAL
jgi:zinc protease